ncbi:MAG: 1-deoxy-D-xylulose-5-phosphate synthase [Clostridia bacterium]|nr:1-deoxy-D-xylulose-5-phosphate synthase [Clostridia bacterium]
MSIILNNITSPSDVNILSRSEKEKLCAEIRKEIIDTVSKNGGHLASNLGVVELTVALFSVFDLEKDTIVWDVGHQVYAHKLLTGRYKDFSTLRTFGGMSGFPSREESKYDHFTTGHSSASISSALGADWGAKLRNQDSRTIAIIGDGSMTGGLAFEGLNNAGRIKRNFIVILNDNEMSISKNVGGLPRYLRKLRAKPGYIKAKDNVERILDKIPLVGAPLASGVKIIKDKLKSDIVTSTIFDELGFDYYGPYDGNDLELLIEVLSGVKNVDKPVLVHISTKKGKGYALAEETPSLYHGVAPFDKIRGAKPSSTDNFSEVFGTKLCEMAEKNDRVCAITAAMASGTGLEKFSRTYKSRFFDVGIAEEHAVAFSGGLAEKGLIPYFAVYSTFLQRSYDNLIHDIALQNLKAVICVDRAGIVGEDGRTHNGVFDAAYLRTVPNIHVYSPTYYDELEYALENTLTDEHKGIIAIRYPRGKENFKPQNFKVTGKTFDVAGNTESDTVLVTYGRLFSYACMANEKLGDKDVKLVKLNRITPVDPEAVRIVSEAKNVLFFEEGIKSGGIGEGFFSDLMIAGFRGKAELHAIENGFVSHGAMNLVLEKLKLDDSAMVEAVLSLNENK